MKELVLFVLTILVVVDAKPQGPGHNYNNAGYTYNAPKNPSGSKANQLRIPNTYLPPPPSAYNQPRQVGVATFQTPPPPPANNFQPNPIPIGLANSQNTNNVGGNIGSSLPVSPFPASNGGNRGASLPVSPFPASNSGNQNQNNQFPQNQFGPQPQQQPQFNNNNNNFNQFQSNGQYLPPQTNDLFEEMPPNSQNGRVLGKASYTFVGKDGITRAVEGQSMFQQTGRKTHKLGIPSAAIASLAGGGLG